MQTKADVTSQMKMLSSAVLFRRAAFGFRHLSSQDPVPDLARAGTADLCDIHHPKPVDEIHKPALLIAQPIFRQLSITLPAKSLIPNTHRDFGGNRRCHGIISTVKCFENNPLVREALHLLLYPTLSHFLPGTPRRRKRAGVGDRRRWVDEMWFVRRLSSRKSIQERMDGDLVAYEVITKSMIL